MMIFYDLLSLMQNVIQEIRKRKQMDEEGTILI